MNQILEIVIKGTLIGIIISAPMGPVGLLCIQRTIRKGKWAGFFTGVGAACSDIIYCIIAGIGVSIISNLITDNHILFQSIGSIILYFFGLYTFFTRHTTNTLRSKSATSYLSKYLLTGFLFTISNPLILFLILGLYSQFNFINNDTQNATNIIKYISIFTGALLWWFCICSTINLAKSKFNSNKLTLINKILGTIIIIISWINLFFCIKDYNYTLAITTIILFIFITIFINKFIMVNNLQQTIFRYVGACIGKFISILYTPIKNRTSRTFFLIYVILLIIPELLYYYSPGFLVQVKFACFNTFMHISLSYIICIIGTLLFKLSKRISLIWYYTFAVIITLISFTDSFLSTFFNIGICSDTITMLLQTNNTEASEFVQTYCSKGLFWIIIASYVIIISFLILLSKNITYIINRKIKLLICCIFSIVIIISSVISLKYIKYYTPKYFPLIADRVAPQYIIQATTYRLVQGVYTIKYAPLITDLCYKANSSIQIDTCSFKSSNIILCIGESFNKHHSNLYGYSLKTNPKLSSIKNLYIFQDVIASSNGTSTSFQNFLSLSSSDDTCNWNEKPLFPAIFKKAGYNVVFYSNQFAQSVNEIDQFDFRCAFYLNDNRISSLLYNSRNKELFKYDWDFLQDWEKNRYSLEKNSNNLIILHLMGQHVGPKDRYPKSYAYFTPDSIKRPDLTQEQKQEVANYDNATLYNDMVVHQIIEMYKDKDAIIIYFADHGDEANDFRAHIGRSSDFATNNNACAHAQLDVPFIIFVSDLYKKNHPEIIKQIEQSLNKRFMTDDLPHMLLNLGGISNKYYSPKKDLLSPSFDNERVRKIRTFIYD